MLARPGGQHIEARTRAAFLFTLISYLPISCKSSSTHSSINRPAMIGRAIQARDYQCHMKLMRSCRPRFLRRGGKALLEHSCQARSSRRNALLDGDKAEEQCFGASMASECRCHAGERRNRVEHTLIDDELSAEMRWPMISISSFRRLHFFAHLRRHHY